MQERQTGGARESGMTWACWRGARGWVWGRGGGLSSPEGGRGCGTGPGDVARGAQGNEEDPSPAQGCDLPVLSQAHVTAPSLLGRLILSGHPPQARSALLRVFSSQHSVPKPSPMLWPRAPSMGSSEHGHRPLSAELGVLRLPPILPHSQPSRLPPQHLLSQAQVLTSLA